jgi:hypothetical protein
VAAALWLSPVLAQQPAGRTEKSADIARLDQAPVIDGRLDEAVWSKATVIRDLHQVRPNEYDAPSERTEFYLFYDDQAVYLGARVWESDPDRITARVLRQGGGLRFEDRVALILDPFYDKRNGYMFEVNPNGVRLDGLWKNTTDFAPEWDGIWEADAVYVEDGWTAEMAIPFKTLSFDPNSDVWGVNLWRFIAHRQETVGWSSQNRAFNPSAGGLIRGFRDLDQGLGLDVVPSISFRQDRDLDAGTSEFEAEPSLDVFYKVTPGLNASLTINTDFSATEVDARQINLTRFSLFFPEQRDFFLKDGDIFEFGKIGARDPVVFQPPPDLNNGKPFFSRRIGLSESGQPVDLDYGGKLSGRLGEWNIGALAIRQSEFEDVQASDIVVARVARNVLAESTLGGIVTYGDPTSNIDNALIGADFSYRNTRLGPGKAMEAEVWYQKTDTEDLSDDNAAFGANLAFPNTNKWRGGIGFKELQDNFNPRLGFISRTGVRNYYGSVGYTHRPRNSVLRTVQSGINFRRFDRIGGGLESQVIFVSLASLANQHGDQILLSVAESKQSLVEPFQISPGVVIPVGDYQWRSWGLNLNTGSQRKLSSIFQVRSGDFWSGEQLQLDGKLTWRPSRHYGVTARYVYQDIDLLEGSFTNRLITLENEIVFSSRWAWVTLAQYDNVSGSLGVHSRLHWIPRAGRDMFFVLNHDFAEENDSFRSTDSELVLKLNYTFRF